WCPPPRPGPGPPASPPRWCKRGACSAGPSTTSESRIRLHDRLQVPEHDVGRTVAVHGVEARAAAVVLDEGRRALVVFGQPPRHRRLLVVLALDEERAVLVAEGVVLGRVVVDVVRGLAVGAPAPAGEPLEQLVARDLH